MIKVFDNFGLSRVQEPKSAVPVTAWKIENSREIGPGECRIALRSVHLERDCFQQFCSECGYDETRIKAKIVDVISRRGKLHNPFTKSAGQFHGIIEEMGDEYARHSRFKPGDEVLCITTMTALPIFIERIHSIDYNYGELRVSGYGIVFIGSPLTSLDPGDLSLNYTMAALDEAGSLLSVSRQAATGDRFLIIGKDLVSSMIYAGAIRRSAGQDRHLTIVLDTGGIGTLAEEQVHRELSALADTSYILDVTQPVDAAERILNAGEAPFDMTINCEDLMGAEVLSVILTRSKGRLFFTSIKNSYPQSILISESMGKELDIHVLGHFYEGYEEYTFDLLRSVRDDLDRINALYESQKIAFGQAARQSLAIGADKAGRVDDFIYSSPVTEALVDEALNIANYDCNVIIQGETGVGKEKILGLIHKNSIRKGKPCVRINCATIQETLAESEFFGYEAGAFTGAQSSGKKGYFEIASGGILFLDEVGTLSLNLQSKLLRVLQENQFYKVGGTAPININVRVICASNVPLRQLVAQGRFREDLYYRLNIYTLTVPPLRDRREDIAALAAAFLENYCKIYGTDKSFDSAAVARLAGYDFPGNVRELENLVHRIVIGVRGHIITGDDVDQILGESIYEDLVLDLKHSVRLSDTLDFNKIVEQQEIRLIEYALKKCGSTRKAAEYLNMTQPQLMRKKQKYGIG